MGSRAELIEGLKIIEKYDPSEYVCAEHDIIFCAHANVNVSDEDAKRLEELGFFIDSETDSWAFFT